LLSLPPCQALSLSVGENNSMRAPTTSSANCLGNRPVILPMLCYNSTYIIQKTKQKLKLLNTPAARS